MKRTILNLVLMLSIGLMMTSCSDQLGNADDDSIIPSSFTQGSDCLELVYPLSYVLPDGSEISVADKTEKKEAIQAWKEENPDVNGRVELVFPVEAVTAEEETISIETKEELRSLLKECKGERGESGSPGRKGKCFELVYPVSYLAEDGTIITGEDRSELRAALKAYKKANPDAETRPELVFPIQVINSDEETIDVLDEEALIALKESC